MNGKIVDLETLIDAIRLLKEKTNLTLGFSCGHSGWDWDDDLTMLQEFQHALNLTLTEKYGTQTPDVPKPAPSREREVLQ
jgi:hypothetical protein